MAEHPHRDIMGQYGSENPCAIHNGDRWVLHFRGYRLKLPMALTRDQVVPIVEALPFIFCGGYEQAQRHIRAALGIGNTPEAK